MSCIVAVCVWVGWCRSEVQWARCVLMSDWGRVMNVDPSGTLDQMPRKRVEDDAQIEGWQDGGGHDSFAK